MSYLQSSPYAWSSHLLVWQWFLGHPAFAVAPYKVLQMRLFYLIYSAACPHWSATKSNSWNAFDLEISILLPNSQASFLTIGIHPKHFTLMCSQNILETNCLGMLYTYLAIKEAQILKYLLWYFAKLTGFFKIQYFKGHTPDWVLPKSLNADNSGQLYWLWQKKLKPGRQVSQCLMKSMICKRSETIMTIL